MTSIQPINTTKPKPISYEQALGAKCAIKHAIPEKFDSELLLKRIKAGGKSGRYLAQAYISAYWMAQFKGSLGDVIFLDAEGLALFIDIINIRKIKGWEDHSYCELACEIQDIIGEVA